MQAVSACAFPELLRVRIPAGLPEALVLGARVRNTKPAEYVRQAVLTALAQDGVRLRDGRVEIEEPAS